MPSRSLTTKVVEPTGTVFVTVEVGCTILLLPENPMARRLGKPAYRIFLRVSAKLLRCSAARADTKLHHTLETGTEKG